MLPQSVFFFPYAGLAFDAAVGSWPRARRLLSIAAAFALAPALLGVASVDATLLRDPRYEVERFLLALPAGTHIEVYGSVLFLPRIPPQFIAVRPGVEPLDTRQPISGIRDIVDPAMDPRPRAPEVIVLAKEFSRVSATLPQGTAPFGVTQYTDERSTQLFRGLYDGSLGYARTQRVTCSLPRPLECRNIHGATGGEPGSRESKQGRREGPVNGECALSLRRSQPPVGRRRALDAQQRAVVDACQGSSVMRSEATKTAVRRGDHGVSRTVPSRLVRLETTTSSGWRSSRNIDRPNRWA